MTPGGRDKAAEVHGHPLKKRYNILGQDIYFEILLKNVCKIMLNMAPTPQKKVLNLLLIQKIESQIYLTLPDNYENLKGQLEIPSVAIIGRETTVVSNFDIRSMKKNFNMEIIRIKEVISFLLNILWRPQLLLKRPARLTCLAVTFNNLLRTHSISHCAVLSRHTRVRTIQNLFPSLFSFMMRKSMRNHGSSGAALKP